MEIQEKIEALRKEIEYHVERYYNQDDPEIPITNTIRK